MYSTQNKRVYRGARMYMSTNSTVEITPGDISDFQRAVQAGIAILNGEGYNLIKDGSFEDDVLVPIDSIPNLDKRSTKVGGIKKIKYTNANSGAILTMANGKRTIYLGKGYLYEKSFGETRLKNRQKSYEIYVDFTGDVDVQMNTPGLLEIKGSGYIFADTLVGKRQAIRMEEPVKGRPINKVSIQVGSYTPDIYSIVLID